MNSDRFKSLAELKGRHAKLVEEVGADLLATANFDRVKEFVSRAVATGAVLEAREDRAAAQDLIGFWAAQVTTAVREHASDARKTRVTPTTEPAPEWTLGDTLLKQNNPAEYREAVVAAEKVLADLSLEDRALARRIVLRMVRLKPGTPTPDGTNFDPVPATRGVLNDLGLDADVERLVKALVEAGVLRVVPGKNPSSDQVTISATTLMADWPTLRDWMAARMAVRERAARYASRRAKDAGQSPSWDKRLYTQAILRLAVIGRWAGRQIDQFRGQSATAGLLDRNELAEVLAYQDRNAEEQLLITDSQIWEQKTSDAHRVILGLLTLSLVVALGFGLATLVSARQARTERTEKDQALKRIFANRFARFGMYETNNPELELWAARRAAQFLRSADLKPDENLDVVRLFEKGLRTTNQGSLLTVYKGSVSALAFSRDGKRLITGSDDGTAQVWGLDLKDKRLLYSLGEASIGNKDRVLGVAFSPDGDRVATASANKQAIIWDLNTKKGDTLLGHEASVIAVTFSPDRKAVATVDADGTVLLWNAEKGKGPFIQRRWEGQPAGDRAPFEVGADYAFAFDPDGEWMAVVGRRDGETRLLSTSKNDQFRVLAPAGYARPGAGSFGVPAVVFKGNDRLVVSALGRSWDVEVGEKDVRVHLLGQMADIHVRQWLGQFVFTKESGVVAPALTSDSFVRVHFWKEEVPPRTTWLSFPKDSYNPTLFYNPSIPSALAPRGDRFALAASLPEQKVQLWVFDVPMIANPIAEADAKVPGKSGVGPTVEQYQSILRDIAPIQADWKLVQELASKGDYRQAKEKIQQGLLLPGLENDEEAKAEVVTEAERLTQELAARSVWANGEALARNADDAKGVDAAVADFDRAHKLDPNLPAGTRKVAQELAGLSLANKARDTAIRAVSEGEGFAVNEDVLKTAINQLRQAREWFRDSVLREPEDEARFIVARTLVDVGLERVKRDKVDDALAAYELAEIYDNPKDYYENPTKYDKRIRPALNVEAYNKLCWWGSLRGKTEAEKVLFAGEKAWKFAQVENETEPDRGKQDTRGLARALTGDIDGAIEDFEAFTKYKFAPPKLAEKRKRLVEILRKERRFPDEEREKLRKEEGP